MADYDGSIRINTKIDSKEASTQLMTLQNRITKTADKIASLKSKMDALKVAKIPTQEYKEVSDQIAKAEAEFNKLLEKQEQMQREGKDNGAAWDRLNQKMDEAGNTIRYAKGELQDLIDTGKAFTFGSDTGEFSKIGQQLKYAENDMDVLVQKHKELTSKQGNNSDGYKKLGNSARKSLQSVGSIIKNAKNQAISMGTALKNIATRIFPFLNRSAQKTDGFFRTMGSRLKGLALSLLIFNQISKVFNSAISGMKEGIGNLAQYSSSVNAALSSMKSALTQLKNSLASAFAPILTVVAPILTRLINMLARAVTYIGMFIAALTGKKTFQKAVAVQEDYAGGLKDTASAAEDTVEAAKEANRQLSSLDKLNNLTSPDSNSGAGGNGNTGGGGGGGGISPGDMFETVEIPGAISDLAAEIREAIKRGDWESVGETIREALTSALERINWDSIYEKARGFGKGLANFFNGLISPELFGAVGRTIAGALNTAIYAALSFGQTFDWKNFGLSIANGINEFFRTYDFAALASTLNVWAKGILDTVLTAIGNTDWRMIGEKIGTFLAGLDFIEIGKLAGQALWEAINAGVDLFKGMFSIAPVETTILGAIGSIGMLGAALSGIGSIVSGVQALFAPFLAAISSLHGLISTITTPIMEMFSLWAGGAGTLGESFMAVFGVGGIITVGLTALAAGLAYVYATNEDVRESFMQAISAIRDGLQPALELLTDTILPSLNAGWERLKEVLSPLGEFLNGVFVSIWQDMINPALSYIGEKVLPILTNAFENLWNKVLVPLSSFLGDVLGPVIEVVSDILSMLWKDIVVPLANAIGNVLGKAFEGLCDIFNFVIDAIQPLIDVFQYLWNNVLSPIVNFLWDTLKPVFEDVFGAIGEIIENIGDVFGGLIDFITGIFTMDWQRAWNGIVDVFKGIFNIIPTVVETVINAAISLINGIVNGINSVTGLVGIPRIPNIPNVSIPRLATGTVVPPNREFMAVLGDNKREPEIVSPLSTIEKAVENAMRKNGGMGSGEIVIKVPLYIDGREVTEAVVKADREHFARTGAPLFSF